MTGGFGAISPDLPDTWQGRTFLTLDVDWAGDEMVEFCLEMIASVGVPVVLFATHNAAWLESAINDPAIEVGIHPNFEAGGTGGAAPHSSREDLVRSELERTAALVPSPKLIRPHGLTTAGRWLPTYAEFGLTHLSSVYPRLQLMAPFFEYNGIIQVPIHWSDTGHIYLHGMDPRADSLLGAWQAKSPFSVLLFHPIHVYLNTESLAHYMHARSLIASGAASVRDLRSSRGSILPSFRLALEAVK